MEITLLKLALYMVLCIVFGMGYVVYKFQNFMVNWYLVKRSRGSKLLVEVENPIQDYFARGSFDNGFLRYLARKRSDNPSPSRMISVEDINAVVYSKFGVKCVRVDDAKGLVRPRRSDKDELVPGFNPEKVDEAMQTALFKPNPNLKGLFDTRTWQIIVLISIVVVVVLGIVGISTGLKTDQHVQATYTAVLNMTSLLPKV